MTTADKTPEQMMDEAINLLDRAYHQHVRELANDIAEEISAGDIPDRESLMERVHETCDGDGWVIYTRQAQVVLMVSSNDDAWEDLGQDGAPTWRAKAYCALERDVYEALERIGVDVNAPFTCATCEETHDSADDAAECCADD